MDSAPVSVRTFVIVDRAFWDPQYCRPVLAGILSQVGINPQTHTNDRADIAVEFSRPLQGKHFFEFRVVRLDGDPIDVHREAFEWNFAASELGDWLFFTLISLEPAKWSVGRPHAIELWNRDRRLAYREIGCVPIEDAPEPPVP